MTQVITDKINNAQKIYTPLALKFYNLYVLRFSNRFIWHCKSKCILEFYNKNITANHLDVGVGTGYFLDHAQFPSSKPSVALLDLNNHCLQCTSKLLSRYQPKIYHANIFQPLTMIDQKFDSIGLNYVLHCLPGSFTQKSNVISNLKSLLTKNGILFGSTILAKDQTHNWLGSKLLTIYNKKGIFDNWKDDRFGLEEMLNQHFFNVEIKVMGTVAFFTVSKPRA